MAARKRTSRATAIIPVAHVERFILFVRDQRVILDADLAQLYGVSTKRLNEQVKRNIDRFPDDFMFQLSPAEKSEVVANCDHLARLKFSPVLPRVFTEHGVIMAANVLNTRRAVSASVFVVRAFVRLRHVFAGQRELAVKLVELERRLQDHDAQLSALIEAIRELMADPQPEPKPPIGYATEQNARRAHARHHGRLPRKREDLRP